MAWQDDVSAALESIPGAEAYFFYPPTWPDGTVITFSSASEKPDEYADDAVYQEEIVVKVDVWDMDPLKVWGITEQVKAQLLGIDYHVTFSTDMQEPASGRHHKSMRFTHTT